MDENQKKNETSESSAASQSTTVPAAVLQVSETDLNRRRCCFGLLAALKSEGFIVFVAVLFMVVISAMFTMGMQLYSLGWPSKSTYSALPSDIGLKFEEVKIPTVDPEVTVAGWFIPAAEQSDSVILALHGYGSNKSEVLPRVGFLAVRHNLLVIDLRYFGETTGEPTTLGVKGIAEVEASLAWLRARGFSRIGLYGMSMGGGLALRSLADDATTQCAVVESPFVDLRLVVRDSYKNFGFLTDYATDATISMARLLGVNAPDDLIVSRLDNLKKPVLVIRPLEDTVVNPGHFEELQSALADDSRAEYWLLPGKGYGDIADGFVERIDRFYAACL